MQVQTHLLEVRMERATLIKLKESMQTSACPFCLLIMAIQLFTHHYKCCNQTSHEVTKTEQLRIDFKN